MNKPNATDRSKEQCVQPQPAEPDFTQTSRDKATRLPLPGELREPQPPVERKALGGNRLAPAGKSTEVDASQ